MDTSGNIFEDIKKEKERFDSKAKELKKDKHKLDDMKKKARGESGGSVSEINEARLILFVMGESYMTTAEAVEGIEDWTEEELSELEGDSKHLAKKIKERDLPKNIQEVRERLEQEDTPKAQKMLKKIEKIDDKNSSKEKKVLKDYADNFLEKEDRRLIKDQLETEESIDKFNKCTKQIKEYFKQIIKKRKTKNPFEAKYLPGYVKNLLNEKGRPDLLYYNKPKEIKKHLELMKAGGLSMKDLGPEVWCSPIFIDSLSEGQMFELCTDGSSKSRENVIRTIAKYPQLLINNERPGQGYKAKRSAGLSRFAFRWAWDVAPEPFNEFLKNARQYAENRGFGENYQDWLKSVLIRHNAKDMIAMDIQMFTPQLKYEFNKRFEFNKRGQLIYKKESPQAPEVLVENLEKETGKKNLEELIDPDCGFMAFTRYATPDQLALQPADSQIATERKPIITEAYTTYRDFYEKEKTKSAINDLNKIVHEPESDNFKEFKLGLASLKKDIEDKKEAYIEIGKANVSEKTMLGFANEFIKDLTNLRTLYKKIPLDQQKSALSDSLKEIQDEAKSLLNLEEMIPVKNETFNPEEHDAKGRTKPGETRQIKKVLSPGWKLSDRVIRKAKVELN
jgi:molecular chaperone GrpE (heat shock protein)